MSASTVSPARGPRPPSRKLHPAVIWGFIILIMGGLIIGWNYYVIGVKEHYSGSGHIPKEANLMGRNLGLVDANGAETTLFEIADDGKPWVIGTFYTSCPKQCAGVAEELRRIDLEVGEGKVNFVLLSFDPQRDRPESLKAWARAHDLDHPNWHLLTGPDGMEEEVIYDYLKEPLKMWAPKWKVQADGSRDLTQEPEHPVNVIVLTGEDMRKSFVVGVNDVTTPAMVRFNSAEMVKILRDLAQ